MATLLNREHPYFRIMDPVTGAYYAFVGGKLEIEEGDPGFDVVMAEAARNPYIAVYKSVATCIHCGETLASAKAREAHVKDNHFDKWLADADAAAAEVRNVEVMARAGFPCDVCRPLQEFGTPEDLALHVGMFHTAAPNLDDDGNEVGGGKAAAPVSSEAPAATPSSGRSRSR